MPWPNQNPTNNSNGGLLASLASRLGLTNFSTLAWAAQVEVLLANLLLNDPPGLGMGLVANTVTSIGTAQNSTPTAAQLLTGIVTQTGATGAGTVTLPIGSLLSGAQPIVPSTGYTFSTLFVNLGGGQTLTITGDTGTTVVGTAAVGTGKAATLTFVCTGANTWNVYCQVSA